MKLHAGRHVITVHVVREGNMNLLHLDFVPKGASAAAKK
jgi:hypothetical protein